MLDKIVLVSFVSFLFLRSGECERSKDVWTIGDFSQDSNSLFTSAEYICENT